MSQPHEPTAAAILRQLTAVVASLERVAEHSWRKPTRCRPWDVRRLAAHLAIPAASLTNGLAALRSGSDRSRGDAPLPDDVNSGEVLQTLQERTARLEDQLSRLTPDELDRPLPPQADGDLVLPARTVLQLVLVEIGVHRSDMDAALGDSGSLDDDVIEAVAAVVPAWLILGAADSPRPTTELSYRLSGDRLDIGFRFEPRRGWRLELTSRPTCRIGGDDSTVALFLMGRAAPTDGQLAVAGDADAARRFKSFLPGP